MSARIIMIHEVLPWMFEEVVYHDDDILTFDDGLYSQYRYANKFPENLTKIFFISSNIICPEDVLQNQEILTCSQAHENFFSSQDVSNYMKISQIKELQQKYYIGMHGHYHTDYLASKEPLVNKVDSMRDDILRMTAFFFDIFGEIPDKFCWPYNRENLFYRGILNSLVSHMSYFGDERIDVYKLK